METQFLCVHGCLKLVSLSEEDRDATAQCGFCGTRYGWKLFGTSSGGYGHGPYYDRGPVPPEAIAVGTVTLRKGYGQWESDVVSPAAVVEL